MSSPGANTVPQYSKRVDLSHLPEATCRLAGKRLLIRRQFVLALGVGVLAPMASFAQQPAKVWRVGYLQIAPRNVQLELIEAFEHGLQERGYAVARNVQIDYRFADGNVERLPDLAAELVRLKVDVIVTGVNANVRALQRATTTIPIVTATSYYPVEDGMVASLGRPGGNVTGISAEAGGEISKRLQFLRELTPKLKRVAILSGAGMSYNPIALKVLEGSARELGVSVMPLEIRGAEDVGPAFAKIERARIEGLIVFGGPITLAQRSSIMGMAAKKKLPAIWSGSRVYIDEGALISYGADVVDLYRRSAGYVDRILKGAKPADLPIEQPAKFVLAINLKTAKALGIKIPSALMLQATKVIE